MRPIPIIVIAVLILSALPVAAQNANVLGTVRTAEGGVQLADMTVAAYNSAGFLAGSTVTDSLGRFLLTLPPGTYRLLAFDRSGTYATNFYNGASSFETSQQVNLSPGQALPINFALPRGLQISGMVLDNSTGAPLAGAIVSAYNADGSVRSFTSTALNGTFTLVVPAGAYKLAAYHEVLPFVPEFYPDKALFESASLVAAPASGIVFSIERGAKIHGTVKAKTSDQPVEGLNVVAYDLQGAIRYRTTTNPAGEYSLVVPAGSYKIAVDDPGHVYETTFFRDAKTFQSAAVISVNGQTVPPDVNLEVSRASNPPGLKTFWIAAAANATGANNTLFQTDVWIHNPTSEPITVNMFFLRGGQDNTSAAPISTTVAAHGQKQFVNILNSVFAASNATGGLRFESESTFKVTSRTYNVPPNASQIGTFGLAIPGQDIGASLSRATLAGLSNNAASRTNIGILNPQPTSTTVHIDVFGADGAVIRSETITLRPSEWTQLNNFVPASDNAYAVLSSEDGSFFSYGSVVDQKSGDGTIILPSAE